MIVFILVFFFKHAATTEIYTLSLHDALPIFGSCGDSADRLEGACGPRAAASDDARSEEHTSELQSRGHLVCRLLLEKKKKSTLIYKSGLKQISYKKVYNFDV